MEDARSPHETALSGFPQSPSDFDGDPRISFSKLEDKWMLETEDGVEYEFVNGLKRWVPVVGTHKTIPNPPFSTHRIF
jgi:HIV Tat-specific factor 1